MYESEAEPLPKNEEVEDLYHRLEQFEQENQILRGLLEGAPDPRFSTALQRVEWKEKVRQVLAPPPGQGEVFLPCKNRDCTNKVAIGSHRLCPACRSE